MSNYTVDKHERNGFTVTIEYDPDCPSPRDDDSPGAQLALFARHYTFPNDPGLDPEDFTGWADMAACLRREHGAVHIMAVHMMDHSGLYFRASDLGTGSAFPEDPGRWDSGCIGFAYVDREVWEDTQGTDWQNAFTAGPEAYAEQARMARSLIISDVEQYGMYVNGECFAYTVTDRYGEILDDCAGFIGIEYATSEADMAADWLKHVAKCSGELDRTAGQITHTGPCPLHDPAARLEAIRASLRREDVSYGELAELQGLTAHIEPGDIELLEAAGVPEHP
jgi:hypothetical protein